MHCAACGAGIPSGAKFCPECGLRQQSSCPACGSPLTSASKFCSECGTPLAAGLAAPTAGLPEQSRPSDAGVSPAPVAERRITSVLFGDLVGFTTLSEVRDPEEVRELLSRYFAESRTVVERYGGTVEKFIGDAVMAVWGVPVAHEDDAERAVRAGLDLVASVEALREQVGAPDLAMRVGIVTGEVAATVGAVGEGMVAGDAVNTSARVQAAATSGQVWVDEATHSLTDAAVSYADAGEHQLKGKAEPVRLFAARAVVAAVGGAQRVDGLEAPFTGRDRELRLVKELFNAVSEDGRPRLVAVSGVAGVGKSRLGWELEKYVDGISQRVGWHRGRALSYGEGVAFWALAEMVRSRLGITDGEPPVVAQQRLATGLQELVPDADERIRLQPRLGVLLGLEARGSEGSTFAREDLFAAWSAFFGRVAVGRQCVVLVIEDMQYADSGLLDFLDYLLESARFPLFVLTLARPELIEARPRFGTGRRATPVYLEPLGDSAMGQLVDGLVSGLPTPAHEVLVRRAEGIPLYAVETVRALIDRDAVVPREGRYVLADAASDADLAELGAPTSLQALIAARLDTLSPDERRAVGDASVHGMTFSRGSLEATSPVADLAGVLASLVRKEIVAIHDDPFTADRGQYRFVQALVRTVAYETLSRRDRKARHLAVAAQITADQQADELAGVLARHYLDALDAAPGDPDAGELRGMALDLLERAAARAQSLGSAEEAHRHYLLALDSGPEPVVQARLHEGAAGAARSAARSEDALRHAEQARALYDELGHSVDAGRAVAVTGGLLVDAGRLQEAIDSMTSTYERLLEHPAASGALAPLSSELARALSYRGSWSESERYAKRALQDAEARCDWPRVVELLMRYGTLWVFQGMPTGGLAMLRSAGDLGRQHHLRYEMIGPLANIASFHNSRDLAVAQAAAREAIVLAGEFGIQDVGHPRANLSIGLWLSGGWDEVEEVSRGTELASLQTRLLLTLMTNLVRRARGNALVGDIVADDDADDPYVRATSAQLQSLAAEAEGRLEEASRLSSSALDTFVDAAGLDDDFAIHWPVAVEHAIAAGRLSEAERLVSMVAATPVGLVTPLAAAQLLRLRGLLLMAQGATERVDEDLTGAAEEFRAFGAPFYLALTLLSRAEFLHGGGVPVQPLLDEAGAIFASLQAQPWVEATERVGVSVATS